MAQNGRLYGRFKFHPVGQGLFYTGEIEYGDDSFVFVYDCGGTNRTIASDAADRFIDSLNGKKIDLLVLSHLHEDHINGIETILKALKPDGIIVMPYIDQSLQLLYQYEFSARKTADEFLSDFYKDPIGIISNNTHSGVSIYMVSSSVERETDETYTKEETEVEYSEKAYRLSRKDGKKSNQLFFTNSFVPRFHKVGLDYRITQPYFDEKTYTEIKQYVDTHKSLLDLLKDKNAIKELKDKNRLLNESCLLMEHWFSNSSNTLECILTGDLEDPDIQEFNKKLRSSDERPLVFQIPHHGAKANPSIRNSVFSVVSFGIKNRYRHPDWGTLGQYIDAGSRVVVVNERFCFCLEYRSSFWRVNGKVCCIGYHNCCL